MLSSIIFSTIQKFNENESDAKSFLSGVQTHRYYSKLSLLLERSYSSSYLNDVKRLR